MNRIYEIRAIGWARLFVLVCIFALTVSITVYLSGRHSVAYSQPAAAVQEPPIFGDIWARTELFFGTSRPNGPAVNDEKFRRFIDQEITPRFPDGLTQVSGFGQFKNSQGVIVQERSHVIILLYPLSDTDASNRIEAIRVAYKQAFQQESVLRVDSRAGVSF
jgi:hypothetical protein